MRWVPCALQWEGFRSHNTDRARAPNSSNPRQNQAFRRQRGGARRFDLRVGPSTYAVMAAKCAGFHEDSSYSAL